MNVVAHNISSMFSNRQLGITTLNKAKSTEKLSSGYKINRAADDAAGLSISEKMRKQIRGLRQGLDNTQDGVSFIQIADGAMEEVHDIIHRMIELSVKAANGSTSVSDRADINQEIKELKYEINRIGVSTKFNEQKVFLSELKPPTFNLTGKYFSMDDINIYNSSYDPKTGAVEYGGIIYNGERFSWNSIDPDMVNIDSEGNQTFVGGEYSFVQDGQTIIFQCEDGAAVPSISREIQFSGNIDNIFINSQKYDWESFYDENGTQLSLDTIHSGKWKLLNSDMEIVLEVEEDPWNFASLGDVKDAAAMGLLDEPDYFWKESWANSVETLAMRTTGNKIIDLTDRNSVKSLLDAGADRNSLTYRVRAGKEDNTGESGHDPVKTTDYSMDGIWLEEWKEMDKYDSEGNPILDSNNDPVREYRWVPVNGSLQSWSQAGFPEAADSDWNSGTDIRKAVAKPISYSYIDEDGTTVGFSFNLKADVTSIDSVIEGLDGAMTASKNLRTNYSAHFSCPVDSNILSASASINKNFISAREEYDFNRDYSSKTQTDVVRGTGAYDGSTGVVSMSVSNGGTDTSIDFAGNSTGRIKQDIQKWGEYVKAEKINGIIKSIPSIASVVGDGNITDTGLLSEEFTITSAMKITDGLNGIGGAPGEVGVAYGCAHIDFKDVANIMDLADTGFDTTCGFCDNHYSVVFTSGAGDRYTSSVMDKNGNELKYNLVKQAGSIQYRGHFLMEIDLDSIAAAGYDKNNISSAIVDVLSGKEGYGAHRPLHEDGFDFHYTQYAAEGSVLYIYNNQPNIEHVNSHAIFGTNPYDVMKPQNIGDYQFQLSTTDGSSRYMSLSYRYNYSDIEDGIIVNIESAGNTDAYTTGEDGKVYEKVTDTSGKTRYLEYAAPATPPATPKELYKLSVTYTTDPSNPPAGQQSSLNDLVNAYSDKAINKMLSNSKISFDATDYTKITWNTVEQPNEAITSNFESNIWSNAKEEKVEFLIQHSSELSDYTMIPKFGLNTFVLGIQKLDISSIDGARQALDQTSKALRGVSVRRSLYGAYQNRLEHTIKNHDNVMENTTAAESRIRDTDMAAEMVRFSKESILQQAGQSMLAQANQQPQGILQLLM